MSDRPAGDRLGIILAVLGGVGVLLAAGLIILFAARGDDGSDTTGADSSSAPTTTLAPGTTGAGTTTTAPIPTTTTAPPTTAPFVGDREPKSGSGTAGLLTGVRVGRHEGFTRLVFDFREPTFPNWEVSYVPGPIEGMVEPEGGWVEGEAFLVARFQPSGTADLSGDEVVMIYDGPRRIDVGAGSVVQLLIVEDFEANLWWAIGLTGEKPFTVGTLVGPPRIFIDIAD